MQARQCCTKPQSRIISCASTFCISHGAPVAHSDLLGRTALTFAIAHGSISMCEKILANAGPRILLTRTAADDDFIHAALKSNEDALAAFLIEYYIVHQEASGLPAISELMAQRDVLGRTPLHLACHPRKRAAAGRVDRFAVPETYLTVS
jgi:ankyrin repeat protein